MTCIVGIAQGGRVWMGADSLHLAESIVYSAEGKMFRRGEFIIGVCGDIRYGQILAYTLELEQPKPDEDMRRFMATTFAKAVRKAAQEYGFLKQDEGQDHTGCRALVGVRGCLFNLDSVFSYVAVNDGFAAIGSGAQVAVGSLYESQDSGREPKDRIERALKTAEALTEYVRRPFTFDSL